MGSTELTKQMAELLDLHGVCESYAWCGMILCHESARPLLRGSCLAPIALEVGI